MYIHEAINAVLTNPEKGLYITRCGWMAAYVTPKAILGAPAKLMITASPDKLVYVSYAEPRYRPGWQPTLVDLISNDWEQTR